MKKTMNDFFVDSKLSGLNKQACFAIDEPTLFHRIEECVLNAKTDLAKRRLIRAMLILGAFKTYDNQFKYENGLLGKFSK